MRYWWRSGACTVSSSAATARLSNYRDVGATDFQDTGTPTSAHDDGYPLTAPVATMPANPFGLHHVGGNVAEWCRESYMPRAYSSCARRPGDAELPTPGYPRRSVRGGSYMLTAQTMRSASRLGRVGEQQEPDLGVRPVRIVQP